MRTGRKLAILDYDGILSISDKRFAVANASGHPRQGEGADEYWKLVFDPKAIATDTLRPGVIEAIGLLHQQGWELVVMTSIPYRCHAAVRERLITWFGWEDEDDLFMKPNILRINKTATWKANMVNSLAGFFDEVLFVDDEEKNIAAVRVHNSINWQISHGFLKLHTAQSLTEAFNLPGLLQPEQSEEEDTALVDIIDPDDPEYLPF